MRSRKAHVALALLAAVPRALLACSSDGGSGLPPADLTPAVDPQPGAPLDAGAIDTGALDAAPVIDPKLGPQFIDLGDVAQEFTIDVPPETIGFTIEPVSALASVRTGILEVRDPSGKTFERAKAPANLHEDYARIWRFPGNSGSIAVPSGKWAVKLKAPGGVRIARQRTVDGKFHGGALDLFVYVPAGLHAEDFNSNTIPGNVVTAATAPNDPAIKSLLATFFSQLKRLLDLDRGNVVFQDVEAKFLTIPDLAAADQGARLAAKQKDEALGLHVILTESVLAGVANGIALGTWAVMYDRPLNAVMANLHKPYPGSPSQFSTAMGYLPGEATAIAMIHEALHQWGIPHTTDDSLTPYDDGFVDTVQCDLALLRSDPTSCPDKTNLMFPIQLVQATRAVLSPHQVRVIHGTTVYRPYAPK